MAPPLDSKARNLRHKTRLGNGLIPLLNMLKAHGGDQETVLKLVNVRLVELLDPAFTIDFEQEIDIAEACLDYFDSAAPSLELAGYFHLHNFSVLGLAMRSCANLAEMFELNVRYPRLVWGVSEVSNEIEDDKILFHIQAGNSRAERFLLERDIACIKTMSEDALDAKLSLDEVWFSHEAPADIKVYEDFFSCPVRFAQASSGLKMPISELEKIIPTADPLARQFYEAQCARLSANLDQPFRYSYLVRDYLSHITPTPSLESLSEKLRIEPRTLQRLLKKEGETFSGILQEVRLKRACYRLSFSTLSMEQIAEELGFKDAVAFSHAFKSWAQLSPREYRKNNAPDS